MQSDHPSDILLVEDNAINRMIASDMLRNAGHQVTQAENGAEGVATAKDRKFDLILMDISMPDMDGLTAAELIRHSDGQSKDAPIIALTAHSMSSADHQINARGITEVLQKPLTSQALNAALEAALSGARPTDWASVSTLTDKVLDTEILDDVIANIGLAKTREHFEELLRDMQAFTEQDSKQVNGADTNAHDAHRLAGAAAVLGLCALHKRLSQLQDGGIAEPTEAGIQHEWHAAHSAFTEYLDNFSQDMH